MKDRDMQLTTDLNGYTVPVQDPIEFSLESSAKAAGRVRAFAGKGYVDRLKLASHLRVRSSLVTDGIWAAYLEGYIAGS